MLEVNTTYKKDRPEIAKWFMPKLEFVDGHEPDPAVLDIVRETEKAYLVVIGYSSLLNPDIIVTQQQWVPKAAVTSPRQEESRKKANLARHEKLVELAKSNGLKNVRSNLKSATLVTMLEAANIQITC